LVKLPLRDLPKLDLSHLPTTYVGTMKKPLNILSAIVAHAMREGKMDRMPSYSNPFPDIKLSVDERGVEGGGVFAVADRKAILSTAVYARRSHPVGGGGEAAFSLPSSPCSPEREAVLAAKSGEARRRLAQRP